MFLFVRWGNGDVITQAKYVGISGLLTTAFSFMFGFWIFYWFYFPVFGAQVCAYLLVLLGVFKHEPRYLNFAKIILAVSFVINCLTVILYFFLMIFVVGFWFWYLFYMFFFLIVIGIAFTGFATLIVHRAHQAMLSNCSHETPNHPPMPPQHFQQPPPSTGYGVNPSEPGRY